MSVGWARCDFVLALVGICPVSCHDFADNDAVRHRQWQVRNLNVMAVAIRLQRHGTKKHPFYRVVVIDSRKKRDGKYIEALGYYRPTRPHPNVPPLHLDAPRVAHWLSCGAQLSLTAARLYKQYRKQDAKTQENDDSKTGVSA